MKRLLVFGAALCLVGLLRVPAGAQQTMQSQREWMQQNGQTNGAEPGRWVWRVTGTPPPLGPNGWPTIGGTEADPKTPGTCVGCHTWVENKTITQDGFTNILGETPKVIALDVSPKKLLDDAIHTDPTTGNKTYDNKHAENYDNEGCAACHKQHGPVADFGCGKCHVADQENGFATFHATHPVLIEAEQPLGDPGNFAAGKPSCGYCHASINPGVGNAACWNCHMSGHRPVKLDSDGGGVAYWKSIPSAPPAP